MRVAVIGATGALGRQVVPRLVERGHRVRAVVRRAAQAAAFGRLGIEATLGDILAAPSLVPALAGCEVALHLATAVPMPGMPRDFALNDRIRREGTANLIAACREAGVGRYVQQSIAHLAADGTAILRDEDAPLSAAALAQSAADMEARVKASGLAWWILRGGAFYGPGTGRDEEWRRLARDGKLVLPGDGTDYLSLIHVADMADAVVLASEGVPAGAVLAIVDDEPVTYATLYAYLAALEGGSAPQPGGPKAGLSFRISNARAKQALGWRPCHASYRSGLA